MTGIKLNEDHEVVLRFSQCAHYGKAVMVSMDNQTDSADMHLTSKQARALAGWINSNIPKDDEGIEYED